MGRVLVILCFSAIVAVQLLKAAWPPGRAAEAEVVCWMPRDTMPGSAGPSADGGGDDAPVGDPHAALTPVTAEEIRAAPYRYVGRLVFDEGGHRFRATAAFIGPNLLLTAAHNVIDATLGPVSRMAFYSASTAAHPFQNRFDVEAGAYLSTWGNNLVGASDGDDYAVLRTRQSYDGGFLSLAKGDPEVGEAFDILAYSDVGEDDGRTQMFHKRMKLGPVDDGAFSSDPLDAGPGRAFTHGASGGVWLMDGAAVFSVEVSGSHETENGPVLDANLGRMIDGVAHCGP